MAFIRWRRLMELAALDCPWLFASTKPSKRDGAPSAEAWDEVYATGSYARLLKSEQRHHHRLQAALVMEAHPHGEVLEVGCGEAAFYDALSPHAPARYLGMDLSPVAVESARARLAHVPSAGVVLGDAETFETGERFDAVVFPEVLEYLGDTPGVIARYARFLKPEGSFGVSLWLSKRSVRMRRILRALYYFHEEAVVMAPWGGAWMVARFSPRPADKSDAARP